MKERTLFIAKYYFSLIGLSVLYKPLFLMFNNGDNDCSIGDYFSVATHGLLHDFAVAGYFTVIPLLLIMVSIFKEIPMRKILTCYNWGVAFLFTLAFLADMTLYPYWGVKLDASVLIYLDSPLNAFASITIWHFLLLLLLLAGGTYGIFRLLKLFCEKEYQPMSKELKPLSASRWGMLGAGILIGGVMFIGIRGGVTESTNNIGSVYFSDKQILNHSAVNPIFSFLYSLMHTEDFRKEYTFFEEEERAAIFNGLYPHDEQITDTLFTTRRPNIITIVLEGMSAELIEELGGMKGVTPNFNRLAKEGVLFTNCHANSFRTDRGLICALSGYPSFPKTSVMKSTTKSQKLPSLASALADEGYTNTFIYGGDINFTNMRGYLYSTGYRTLIADEDFTSAERSTHQWGAGDDITFNRLYETVKLQKSSPWHITLLTLSSHEPWSVPYNRIPGDEIANSFAFTDEELGKFIDRLKQTEEWKNTLVICISDHTLARYPEGSKQSDINRNRIPLLFLGGVIKESKRIEAICNQSDLVGTILPQLGISNAPFPFSRNILGPGYTYPFAYHCFNNGFTFIDGTGISVFDLDSRKAIHTEPADGGKQRLDKAKAILQTTYFDFYNK